MGAFEEADGISVVRNDWLALFISEPRLAGQVYCDFVGRSACGVRIVMQHRLEMEAGKTSPLTSIETQSNTCRGVPVNC